jgi:hypothetical protein
MLAVLTMIMIIVCFAQACKLRGRWVQLSRRAKSSLLISASFLVVVYTSMIATRWIFVSPWVNEIVGSAAVGSYSLLVLLLTLFRPKIATYSLAAILLLVLPVALVLLPLAGFSQFPIKTEHLAGSLFVKKVHWDAGAVGSSGTTLQIYQKPRFAPFIEHNLQSVRFDDAWCKSDKSFLELQRDRKHVLARCPWHDPERQGFHDFLVPIN